MVNEIDLERDVSILELVLIKIEKYYNGKIFINDLINSLENLLNELKTLDEDWKTNFRTLWFDVEIVYALTLDEGSEIISQGKLQIIDDALQNLRKITEEKIKELKK